MWTVCQATVISLQSVPTSAISDNTDKGGPQHDSHLYTLASIYGSPTCCTFKSANNISYQFEPVQLGPWNCHSAWTQQLCFGRAHQHSLKPLTMLLGQWHNPRVVPPQLFSHVPGYGSDPSIGKRPPSMIQTVWKRKLFTSRRTWITKNGLNVPLLGHSMVAMFQP